MSYSQIKIFLSNLTDIEFLSLLDGCDFYGRKISFKKNFWNLTVEFFVTLLVQNTKNTVRKLCYRIKAAALDRLFKVSTASFRKYFYYRFHIKMRAYQALLSEYYSFLENQKEEKIPVDILEKPDHQEEIKELDEFDLHPPTPPSDWNSNSSETSPPLEPILHDYFDSKHVEKETFHLHSGHHQFAEKHPGTDLSSREGFQQSVQKWQEIYDNPSSSHFQQERVIATSSTHGIPLNPDNTMDLAAMVANLSEDDSD